MQCLDFPLPRSSLLYDRSQQQDPLLFQKAVAILSRSILLLPFGSPHDRPARVSTLTVPSTTSHKGVLYALLGAARTGEREAARAIPSPSLLIPTRMRSHCQKQTQSPAALHAGGPFHLCHPSSGLARRPHPLLLRGRCKAATQNATATAAASRRWLSASLADSAIPSTTTSQVETHVDSLLTSRRANKCLSPFT